MNTVTKKEAAAGEGNPMNELEKEFKVWLEDNLHQARMKKTSLAEFMGVSRQAVTNWVNRANISRDHLAKLETLFGSSSPLTTKSSNDATLLRASMQLKPSADSTTSRQVPEFEWDTIINYSHQAKLADVGGVIRRHQCPIEHSKRTFALTIKNQAMSGTLDIDDVIFVDPEREVDNADYVLTYTEGDKEALVRQYINEGGTSYLVATNRDWVSRHVEIGDNTTVIGVVIAKYRIFI